MVPITKLEIQRLLKLLNQQHEDSENFEELVEHVSFLKEMQSLAEAKVLKYKDEYQPYQSNLICQALDELDHNSTSLSH